jgi:hypothetical protein
MDSDLSRADLVYVSDADGEVTVYRYQTGDLVGVLANFGQPAGECADGAGNVYITDATRRKIYEYAHGGAKPVKTLSDSPYTPSGCSIDPLTGNLAVANWNSVAIFVRAGGKPTFLTDKSISIFRACAYSADGTLLVTGTEGSNKSLFAWLRRRSNQLVNVDVPGPASSSEWFGIYGLQWDGMYFVLDQSQAVFQIALMNGQAYYVGETELDGNGTGQYAIYDPNPTHRGTQLLTSYYGIDSSYTGAVSYFPYPAGGQSDKSFAHGVYNPYGIVISLKK